MEKNAKSNRITFIIKTFIQIISVFVLVTALLYIYKENNTEKNTYKNSINEHKTILKQSKMTPKTISENTNKMIIDTQNLKENVFSRTLDLEQAIQEGKTNAKIAYLSFDDGPYYKTLDVLSILDQYGVKAIFFTTSINGDYCYDNKSYYCLNQYQEYINYGMEVGNHTYTHSIRKGLYKSVDTFMDAVDKQEERIKQLTGGYEAKIVRFPGGSGSAKKIKADAKNALIEKGYGWIDWTALDGDGGILKSSDEAWENFIDTIDSNIEVILLHDYSKITIELLPKIIEYLQNNGYIILPLRYESIMVNK